MKILITGGAGYIGSACAKELVKSHEITIIDNLSRGKREVIDPKAKFIKLDILDKTGLEKIFSQKKFDVVIHLAALKAVGESQINPEIYYETNICGTINILNLMSKYNIQKIIFSSTAAVYENSQTGIYSETDKINPISVYAKTKYICEQIIKDYSQTKNITHVIFRYFNVAGDYGLNYIDENAQNVFPIICMSMSSQKEFEIYGNDYPTKDGTGIRDYIHIADIINAHIKALNAKCENETFNLGTYKGTTVLELVKEFEKISKTKINYKFVKRRPGDVAISLANFSKAKNLLGWEPKIGLSEMIKSTLYTYKS